MASKESGYIRFAYKLKKKKTYTVGVDVYTTAIYSRLKKKD